MIYGANTKTLISCAADLCLCFCIFAYYDTSLNNVNIMGETYLFSSGKQKGTYPCAFAVWLFTCINYNDFVGKCYGFMVRLVQV